MAGDEQAGHCQTAAMFAHYFNDVTLREFDALCIPPVKQYTPTQIKRIRLKSKASQGVFAVYLNTSKSTVQKWEQGAKKPNGPRENDQDKLPYRKYEKRIQQ